MSDESESVAHEKFFYVVVIAPRAVRLKQGVVSKISVVLRLFVLRIGPAAAASRRIAPVGIGRSALRQFLRSKW